MPCLEGSGLLSNSLTAFLEVIQTPCLSSLLAPTLHFGYGILCSLVSCIQLKSPPLPVIPDISSHQSVTISPTAFWPSQWPINFGALRPLSYLLSPGMKSLLLQEYGVYLSHFSSQPLRPTTVPGFIQCPVNTGSGLRAWTEGQMKRYTPVSIVVHTTFLSPDSLEWIPPSPGCWQVNTFLQLINLRQCHQSCFCTAHHVHSQDIRETIVDRWGMRRAGHLSLTLWEQQEWPGNYTASWNLFLPSPSADLRTTPGNRPAH